ncbi:hypothetical protein BMS3Bbin02_01140 [bacterium BMS3Bbin02]|nr:hypothetical protein BMS3Bbin02_01140 [bacterium BMS3Bbin02]HDH27169.1 hypothetical protein [Actinomycetota bacterium]
MGVEVTGVGSLPHRDIADACAFITSTTTVGYIPQLPVRHPSEAMLVQWGDGLAGCGAAGAYGLLHGAPSGERDEATISARMFLESTEDEVIKTQATGPITLGLAMLAGGADSTRLWNDLVPDLIARIDEHIAVIRELAPNAAIVLILDEPSLTAWGSERGAHADLGLVREVLGAVMDGVSVRPGIHCCGDPDWGLVAELDPRWFSWDTASLGVGFSDRTEQIAAAIARGSRVMWGVTPTMLTPMPSIDAMLSRYRLAMARLVVEGAPLGPMHDDAWYTPACGLAGGTIGTAEHVMELVNKVVDEIHHADVL